jgi:hypothetical protein
MSKDNITPLNLPVRQGCTVQHLLNASETQSLEQCLVVGFQPNGKLFVAASNNLSNASVNYLLDVAKANVLATPTLEALESVE